jgi:hypothetical protein
VARVQTRRIDAFIMIATAGTSLALNNVAAGFAVAFVLRLGAFREEDPR